MDVRDLEFDVVAAAAAVPRLQILKANLPFLQICVFAAEIYSFGVLCLRGAVKKTGKIWELFPSVAPPSPPYPPISK